MIDTRVLQADGVQHAGGCFRDPVRGITRARLQGCAFQAYSADIPVGKALYPCIFFTEADTARQQNQWCCQLHATEVHSELSPVCLVQFIHG